MSDSGDFFADAFGFSEFQNYEQTQAMLMKRAKFEPTTTPGGFYAEKCTIGGRNNTLLNSGLAYVPSVAELHQDVQVMLRDPTIAARLAQTQPTILLQNSVGESRSMHGDPRVDGSVVQAASQFNLLEFPTEEHVPENGISEYLFDRTQGPACAIACASGTAYRNYLMPTPFGPIDQNRSRGQRRHNQINCLADVEKVIQSKSGGKSLWTTTNGYVESSIHDLTQLNQLLNVEPGLGEELKQNLRIGVQENTQVTDVTGEWVKQSDVKFVRNTTRVNHVTQTYNSALSIGYSRVDPEHWQPLAHIVLDASYEATLLVGIKQTLFALKTGKRLPMTLLTKVGGGVFQNDTAWIKSAIQRAIRRVKDYNVPLDIHIVHYGQVDTEYENLAVTG